MKAAIRFSRASVVASLRARAESADRDFFSLTGRHFDPGNGYAQVRGMSEEACVAYGRWVALKDAARGVCGLRDARGSGLLRGMLMSPQSDHKPITEADLGRFAMTYPDFLRALRPYGFRPSAITGYVALRAATEVAPELPYCIEWGLDGVPVRVFQGYLGSEADRAAVFEGTPEVVLEWAEKTYPKMEAA